MFTVLFFKCVFFKFSSKKILLNKFSPFPKTNKQFYRYRSIPLFFFMYIVSAGKPPFIMILNQMMDFLRQTAAAVANGTTESA